MGPTSNLKTSTDTVLIRVCGWCNRHLDEEDDPKQARLTDSYVQWLEDQGCELTHGICKACAQAVRDEHAKATR